MKLFRFFIPFHLVQWSELSQPQNKKNKSDQIEDEVRRSHLFVLPLLLSILTVSSVSQPLPDKIRGYKVYRDKVSVNTTPGDAEAAVRVGEPELDDVSLTGITLKLPTEFTAKHRSGKVDMITFHELRVNGIKVEAEEYAHRFEFKKGENVIVPKPMRIFIPASGVVKAAWKEMTESKAEWNVTGRVFVFGRFRRYGFFHRRGVECDRPRVRLWPLSPIRLLSQARVPIDISFTIPNPVRGK